jgi:hypothetical protein
MRTVHTFYLEKNWECKKCGNLFKADGEFDIDNEDEYPTVINNGQPFCDSCGSMDTEVA